MISQRLMNSQVKAAAGRRRRGVIKPLIAGLERRFYDRVWFFHAYAFPYRALVDREVVLAGVMPGETILHIGCGSLPFTAVLAARLTRSPVIAIDCDADAIRRATTVVRRLGLERQIHLCCADAACDQLPSAEVALVALQAAPKEAILANLRRCLHPRSGRAVLRLARPGLEGEYGHWPLLPASPPTTWHHMPTFDRSVLLHLGREAA